MLSLSIDGEARVCLLRRPYALLNGRRCVYKTLVLKAKSFTSGLGLWMLVTPEDYCTDMAL